MFKLLFQDAPLPFTVYDPDMGWLAAHGVIADMAGYPDEVRKRANPGIPFLYLPKFSHEDDVLTAIEETLAEEGRYAYGYVKLNTMPCCAKYAAIFGSKPCLLKNPTRSSLSAKRAA